MKKIAIIPARSGSKGLQNKNIINLYGKPMMAYSIEAAIDSHMFDRVIVSTDSVEYGKIAEQYGAEVMYREERLSNDSATTFMVVENLLGRLEEKYDYFVLLQPTSPMRTEIHIIESINIFEDNIEDFDFLVSMKEAENTSILVRPIEDDLSLKYFNADFSNYRRQMYKEYSPNGAIFIGKIDEYIEKKHFFGARSRGYIMSDIDSIDVDNELDYKLVQLAMKERKEREKLECKK